MLISLKMYLLMADIMLNSAKRGISWVKTLVVIRRVWLFSFPVWASGIR